MFSSLNSNLEYYEIYTYFYISLCLTYLINSPFRWVFLTFPVIAEEFNSNLEYYVWILPIILHTGEFFLSSPVIAEEFYSNLEYYVWDLPFFPNWDFLKNRWVFLSLPVIAEEFNSNLEYYVWDLQLFSNWIFLKNQSSHSKWELNVL